MSHRAFRQSNGISLIEMLCTVFITALVSAAITEIAVTQNVVAFRTYNKLDTLLNARKVANYIERDVHQARFIGDQFAFDSYGSNCFPAGGSNDPYSISGCTDPMIKSFAGYPANWGEFPYSLSSNTLIVQVPIFSAIQGTNTIATPTISRFKPGYWNVDTYVYKIIADQGKPGTGQFLLQRAFFPGERPDSTYEPAPNFVSNSPQTLLSGIVGPINPSDAPDPTSGTPIPEVFSFYTRQHPLSQSSISTLTQSVLNMPPPQSADAPNLSGVAMELELYSDSASKRTDLISKTTALRTEFYVKGNYASVE